MSIILVLFLMLAQSAFAEPVRFVHGKLEVPTYTFGRTEDVAPLFKSLENMGLYPYTILDWNSRAQRPVPVEYESLVLENEYLRAEFLPELGGRIWSAYDKAAKRELFYRTTVIKPGRYNQRGGWPVGNLELYGPFDAHMLTWPGEPWAWALERHADGSATIVLSHVDHFFRNKISLIVTLHPGRAFLETTIRLHNKNLLPNRYLLWTNAGVAATDGSRFVYPMTKTIGHDSSALSTWPIIGGVDLSWNKNNKNMLGVFGLDIFDNFMSIYDYQKDYGTICYTNRLLARGMKTWTFGSGLTALRHMAAYTDSDGLYMETQSGRFIWDGNYEFLDPGKTDGWTEYWYGAGKLGGLTTATRDVAVFLDLPAQRPGAARLAVTGTSVFPGAVLELWSGQDKVWSIRQDLGVGIAFHDSIALAQGTKEKVLNLRIYSADGQILLDHEIQPDGSHPNAVYASDSIPGKFGPMDTLPIEEIYQKGLGHEKFGQLADALDAYRAALEKDPMFSPVHLRMGLLAMERFDYIAARPHFEKVLERDPTNGDAHYFLGLIFSEMNKSPDAQRHFCRILPSSGKFERRDYMMALLALREGNRAEAGRSLAQAVAASPMDLSLRQAFAYMLRKTGRIEEAGTEREAILKQDPTNAFAQSERAFSGVAGESVVPLPTYPAVQPAQPDSSPSPADKSDPGSAFRRMDEACAHHSQGYLELATEYMRLSAWEEAGRVIDRGIAVAKSAGETPYPLLYYYRAYLAGLEDKSQAANQALAEVRKQELKLDIFPFRFEDVKALKYALQKEGRDANAAVLLGDLLYSRDRRSEAMELWRKALEANGGHFFALRDLGMALMTAGQRQEGLALLTRASEARPDHLSTTMLVTNLHARLGNADAARSALRRALDKSPGRDVLVEKLASVEAQLGNNARALELLTAHTFDPTHQMYSLLHLYRGVRMMLALEAYKKGNHAGALDHVRSAARPTSSLGVDDFATVASSRLLMFEALLQEASGKSREASVAWKAAAGTRDDDVESEGLFRAIALLKTGQAQAAREWLNGFSTVNEQRKNDSAIDLRIHAHCLAGFYAALQGNDTQAAGSFRQALEIDQSYLYARQGLAWLDAGLLKGLRQ